MKTRLNRFVLCLLCLLIFPVLAAAQQVSLTILHTNDTHGHLMPFSYPSIVAPGTDIAAMRVRQNIGGIARRATLVKRLRAELEPKGTTVWLIDAGDYSEGSPFSTEYHGEADIVAMNAVGYTFGTIGNHELDNPLSTLKKLLGLLTYPMLCANLTETATSKPLLPESQVRTLGPLKIGIFGVTTREAAGYPAAKDGLIIASEIETAQRMADALHREAGIVIMISHAGEQMDERIAATAPGIDVIVGGHSHTRLPVGELMWHSDELKPKEVNGTVIVQAHQWGGELGRLDLLFDKDDHGVWHVDRYRARLIPVTADIPEDEPVAAIVARYWKPIAARYGEIIGQAAGDFSERGDDLAEYSLVADAVREAMGTQIEFENMGGVRAPLIKGNITRADVVDMDPFGNTIVTFKVTGRQLKDILTRSRPAVSGIRYRMENGQLAEVTVGGQPVDDNRVYTGASNSYFAGVALKGIEVVDTGKPRLDVIIDHIRKKGSVQPSYDGRRVIINTQGR
jgi:2',3'-cyclic-nucleotide 2'-phosphodiesterase (5'-nucleotidase family)